MKEATLRTQDHYINKITIREQNSQRLILIIAPGNPQMPRYRMRKTRLELTTPEAQTFLNSTKYQKQGNYITLPLDEGQYKKLIHHAKKMRWIAEAGDASAILEYEESEEVNGKYEVLQQPGQQQPGYTQEPHNNR